MTHEINSSRACVHCSAVGGCQSSWRLAKRCCPELTLPYISQPNVGSTAMAKKVVATMIRCFHLSGHCSSSVRAAAPMMLMPAYRVIGMVAANKAAAIIQRQLLRCRARNRHSRVISSSVMKSGSLMSDT